MAEHVSFAKNTIFNLFGQGVPLIVALVCLPVVVGGFGPERFGLLVLSWTILGYAGPVDLGIGRAAARLIAAALARGVTEDVPRILGTALIVQSVLGSAAGVVIAMLAPTFVHDVLELTGDLRSSGVATFQLVAVAIPIVLASSSLRGTLYSAQRFDLVNAVVIPASCSMYPDFRRWGAFRMDAAGDGRMARSLKIGGACGPWPARVASLSGPDRPASVCQSIGSRRSASVRFVGFSVERHALRCPSG